MKECLFKQDCFIGLDMVYLLCVKFFLSHLILKEARNRYYFSGVNGGSGSIYVEFSCLAWADRRDMEFCGILVPHNAALYTKTAEYCFAIFSGDCSITCWHVSTIN